MIFLAKHPLVDKYDLSSIKVMFSGAAPLPKDIQKQVIIRIGKGRYLPVLQGYGMTELSILTTFHDPNFEVNESMDESVGVVVPGMSGKVSHKYKQLYLNYQITSHFHVNKGNRFGQWKNIDSQSNW